MRLKKMLPQLVDNIVNMGYDLEPREIQTKSIPKIKSSGDMYIIAPEGSGKSTAAAIGFIQQLKGEFEEAPRAIILVETREKAYLMEDLIKKLSKGTGLRTFVVFDAGKIIYQKDMIYEGLDILIGTPKRINELMSITGIPLTKMKMVVFDDAETIYRDRNQNFVYRFGDAVSRSQFIVVSSRYVDKFEFMNERMMKSPITVTIDPVVAPDFESLDQ